MKFIQQNKLIFFWVIGIIVLLLFIFSQYRSYSQITIFDDVLFVPRNAADNVSTQWRYLKVENIDTDVFLNNVEIQVEPKFENIVYSGVPEDILTDIVPQLRLQLDKANLLDKEGEEHIEGQLNAQYDNNMVIIERVGESFKKNTNYSITFKYRDLNIFSWLIPKSAQYDFTTGSSVEDELDIIETALGFAMSSYIISGNSKVKEYKKGRNSSCSFKYIDEVRQRLVDFPYDTEDYDFVSVDCRYPEENKEILTVKILNPDFEEGKEAFRKELERIGLEENEQLRVEYER